MTLIIDRESNEVRDKNDGTVVGTINGPPYVKPDDARQAIKNQFPSDHASVSVQDLLWTIEVD